MSNIENLKNIHYYDAIAVEKRVTTVQAIADDGSPLIKKNTSWPDVIHYDQEIGLAQIKADLINEDEFNLLQSLAFEISNKIMFPVNTVFLHGLGVLASAMTKSFYYKVGDTSKAVNLYVVTAQPPSTGKSGVNEYFSEPVFEAYEEVNRVNKIKRRKLERDLSRLQKELKNANGNEEERILIELEDVEQAILNAPDYQYATDDTTIEAAEVMASKQKGMFNIVSAEAESINVVVGSVYGDAKSKNNFGVLLKAWDNERHGSNRIGREGYRGKLKASIAVLAQYSSVDTILSAGATGRGLSERFLLLSEPDNLGKRDHEREQVKLSEGILKAYSSLVKNIVNENKVELTLCAEGFKVLNKLRNKIEPEMAEGGLYSNNMQRGFVGKVDKQAIKIASVLHVSEHWQENGDKKTEIDIKYIKWACNIFQSLINEYGKTSAILGYSGTVAEVEKIIEKFTEYKSKNITRISIRNLFQNTKSSSPFNVVTGLQKHLETKILPILCELNYCVVSKRTIYINPNL